MHRAAIRLADKARFLSALSSYGLLSGAVETQETHMSLVFLTPERVYKLKKPLKRSFLDFSTIARRLFFCREELRLNRRLARQTYLGLVPLHLGPDGRLNLGRRGRIVDWLVEMQRLGEADMLDRRIAEGRISAGEIAALGKLLCAFYRSLPPQIADGRLYLRHLRQEHELDRAILLLPEFLFEGSAALLSEADEALEASLPEIEARIAAGLIVEGHGDLRPEHVWVGEPLQIIDSLEFSRPMRLLDPYDEVNYLGMECAMLGADWIRGQLLQLLSSELGHTPSPRLLATYGAFRALLRARLSILHLRERPIRKIEKWRPLAARYLEQARRELAMSRIPATGRSSRVHAAL